MLKIDFIATKEGKWGKGRKREPVAGDLLGKEEKDILIDNKICGEKVKNKRKRETERNYREVWIQL